MAPSGSSTIWTSFPWRFTLLTVAEVSKKEVNSSVLLHLTSFRNIVLKSIYNLSPSDPAVLQTTQSYRKPTSVLHHPLIEKGFL